MLSRIWSRREQVGARMKVYMYASVENLEGMCEDCNRWALKRYTFHVLYPTGVKVRTRDACGGCEADERLKGKS